MVAEYRARQRAGTENFEGRHNGGQSPDDGMAGIYGPLPLNAAAREWARLTGTKRPHRATILRWCTKGCRGVRLTGERAGNVWTVTPQALREFHRQLNERPRGSSPAMAGPVRTVEIARAIEELDAVIGAGGFDR